MCHNCQQLYQQFGSLVYGIIAYNLVTDLSLCIVVEE